MRPSCSAVAVRPMPAVAGVFAVLAIVLAVLAALLITPLPARAGDMVEISTPESVTRLELDGPSRVDVLGGADGPPRVQAQSLERQGYIVQLQGEPLFAHGRPQAVIAADGSPAIAATTVADVAARSASLGDLRARLKADLARLENAGLRARGMEPLAVGDAASPRDPETGEPLVRHEYSRVFNGLAANLTPQVAEGLRALPYVRRVSLDREVTASMYDSVPQIRADEFWSTYLNLGEMTQGQGITVAIIDTGIDYTHPDFGDASFPGTKVIGGHDFVDDDNDDPMDEHGHGTHVAGTVAGNGVVQGVAPEVRLLAYRVLNANGSGYMADIIAALEACVDPDGEPLTDDGADVANLSLGGAGTPDDATSQAVNAAVAAGVVVVVAAGNSGQYGYSTIGSPGCAADAVTVGAVDKQDLIAAFSSRGPTSDFAIKPDLVAPGVSICSSQWAEAWSANQCLDDEHTAISGTSMATPHVAGAAALIRQLHPTWTPAQVKSALANTGVVLSNLDANRQGAGRLDVMNASQTECALAPVSLGFGLCDLAQPVWQSQRELTLTNLADAERSFELAVYDLPTGATLEFELDGQPLEGAIVLAPGASQTISARLSVDTEVVPNLAEAPNAYTGRIEVLSGETAVAHAAYSFVKSHVLRLTLTGGAFSYLVHNRQGHAWSAFLPPDLEGQSIDVLVPEGSYDVVVDFAYVPDKILQPGKPQCYVIHEGVAVSGLHEETMDRAEAVHTMTLRWRTETGDYIWDGAGHAQLMHLPSQIGMWTGTSGFASRFDEVHFNAMSEDYAWEWNFRNDNAMRSLYSFTGGVVGVSQSLDMTNDPEALRKHHLRFSAPPTAEALFPLYWLSSDPRKNWIIGYSSRGSWEPNLAPPFEQDLYTTPDPFPDFGMGFLACDLYRSKPDSGTRYYKSVTMRLDQGVTGFVSFQAEPLFAQESPDRDLGLAPLSLGMDVQVSGTRLFLRPTRGARDEFFRSQTMELPVTTRPTYRLYQQGQLVAEQQVSQFASGLCYLDMPGTADTKLVFDLPAFFMDGRSATGQAVLCFAPSAGDPNPPSLSAITVYCGWGGPQGWYVPLGEVPVIGFAAQDADLAQVGLEWSPLSEGGEIWTPAEVIALGEGEYAGLLDGVLGMSGPVSLRLRAVDLAGNEIQVTLEPGLVLARPAVRCLMPWLPLLLQ